MMFSTPCNACCFHNPETKTCKLGEFCIPDGQTAKAPGLCKFYRGENWARKHQFQYDGEDRAKLAEEVSIDRCEYLILFDQTHCDIQGLLLTVSQLQRKGRITVVDTTPKESRKQSPKEILAALNPSHGLCDVRYELMIEQTEDVNATIHWVSRLVKQPYFLVVGAGMTIRGLSEFCRWFDNTSTRAAFYQFPLKEGNTLFFYPMSPFGVYVTSAYRTLGGNMDVIKDSNTGISLVWHIECAWLESDTGGVSKT